MQQVVSERMMHLTCFLHGLRSHHCMEAALHFSACAIPIPQPLHQCRHQFLRHQTAAVRVLSTKERRLGLLIVLPKVRVLQDEGAQVVQQSHGIRFRDERVQNKKSFVLAFADYAEECPAAANAPLDRHGVMACIKSCHVARVRLHCACGLGSTSATCAVYNACITLCIQRERNYVAWHAQLLQVLPNPGKRVAWVACLVVCMRSADFAVVNDVKGCRRSGSRMQRTTLQVTDAVRLVPRKSKVEHVPCSQSAQQRCDAHSSSPKSCGTHCWTRWRRPTCWRAGACNPQSRVAGPALTQAAARSRFAQMRVQRSWRSQSGRCLGAGAPDGLAAPELQGTRDAACPLHSVSWLPARQPLLDVSLYYVAGTAVARCSEIAGQHESLHEHSACTTRYTRSNVQLQCMRLSKTHRQDASAIKHGHQRLPRLMHIEELVLAARHQRYKQWAVFCREVHVHEVEAVWHALGQAKRHPCLLPTQVRAVADVGHDEIEQQQNVPRVGQVLRGHAGVHADADGLVAAGDQAKHAVRVLHCLHVARLLVLTVACHDKHATPTFATAIALQAHEVPT